MNISIQKIISVLERAQMNATRSIEKQFDDYYINLVKKEMDDIETILFYTDIQKMKDDKFDTFTNVLDKLEDVYDCIKAKSNCEKELNDFALSIKDFEAKFKITNYFKDEKTAKVIFNKSGGTAKGTAITNRITIPTSWIKEMGITEENREVKLVIEDNKIIIEKIK